MVNESTIGVSIKIVIWKLGIHSFVYMYCDFASVHKYGSGYDYILRFMLEFSYAPRVLIHVRA